MVRSNGQPVDLPPLGGLEIGPELQRISDGVVERMKVQAFLIAALWCLTLEYRRA